MPDLVEIRGLRLLGRHGVFDFEQNRPQPFVIDLVLETDLRRPGLSDSLHDTVSYFDVVDVVRAVVVNEQHQLLERLAQRITEVVLEDHRVSSVEVLVRKPHAKLSAEVDYAGVRIKRP